MRKDSTLERRIRLNFPGVIIGVVDVGGGVAISLLLSLSLSQNNNKIHFSAAAQYIRARVYYYSLRVRDV